MYTDDDIKYGLLLSKSMAKMRNFCNVEGSKFKVRDLVKYIGKQNYPPYYKKSIFIVSSVVEMEKDSYEYTLKDFPFLVWEKELVFASKDEKSCSAE